MVSSVKWGPRAKLGPGESRLCELVKGAGKQGVLLGQGRLLAQDSFFPFPSSCSVSPVDFWDNGCSTSS